MRYVIWDTVARCVIGGTYASLKRARGRADRLDMEYGAIRYMVRVDVCSPCYR